MRTSFSYLATAALLALPLVSLAAEYRLGNQPAVLSGEHVTGNVYIAGGSATSIGSVSGDVIAGGGTVLISGDVGSDVLVGGGNVTLIGAVGSDVRVVGGNVMLQGRVGGDIIVGGGQVSIGGPGVGGDVVVAAGTLRLDAPVGGSLKVAGGSVYINAPIKGSITLEANKVTLGPSAIISGTLSYKASAELVKEDGAQVLGQVSYTPRAPAKAPTAMVAGLVSAWIFGKFLLLLACALIIGLLLRRYSREMVTRAIARPLYELGRGFLVVIALPIVSVILVVTILGIPFGILGFIGFFALMLIAWVVTPIIIGSFIYHYFQKGALEVSWKSILLGVFVYSLLGLIPVLGWLVQMVATFITVGVISALKWQIVKEWR